MTDKKRFPLWWLIASCRSFLLSYCKSHLNRRKTTPTCFPDYFSQIMEPDSDFCCITENNSSCFLHPPPCRPLLNFYTLIFSLNFFLFPPSFIFIYIIPPVFSLQPTQHPLHPLHLQTASHDPSTIIIMIMVIYSIIPFAWPSINIKALSE